MRRERRACYFTSNFRFQLFVSRFSHVAALRRHWRNSFNLWERKRRCLKPTNSTIMCIIIRCRSPYYGQERRINTISTNSTSTFFQVKRIKLVSRLTLESDRKLIYRKITNRARESNHPRSISFSQARVRESRNLQSRDSSIYKC